MSRTIRILHLDSDEAFLETASALLQTENDRFEITTTTDATAALESVASQRYDCILSGYAIPELNGIAVLERVREIDSTIPFILFTGSGDEAVASDAISAGVTDYLQKSTNDDDYALLSNRIENAVAARRRTADATQERHRLRQILKTLPNCVVQLNPDGEFVFANQQAKDVLGLEQDELRDRTFKDPEWNIRDLDGNPIPEDELPFRQVLDTAEPVRGVRHTIQWPDGTERALLVSGVPVFTGDEIDSVVFSIADITDRRERERELATLHEATRELYEAKTTQDVARIASDAATTILGFDINGVHLYDDEAGGLAPTAVSETTKEFADELVILDEGIAWEAYQQNEVKSYGDVRDATELYDSTTDVRSGLYFPLGEHGVLIASSPEVDAFDDGDLSLGNILAANATSALDRVERESLLREQTAALKRQNRQLDEFSSVVAHDLRNPLQVADGKVRRAQHTEDISPLDDATQALERMDALIDDLLALARENESVSEMTTVAIGDLADRCWQNIDSGLAALTIEDTVTLQADASRLQQVIENLFANAIEHGGESVQVTVGALAGESGFYIADDGTGIPEADRELIFESGYSTSSTETGFGLAIVRQIIEAHGWEIVATESDAGGARFEIRTDVD